MYPLKPLWGLRGENRQGKIRRHRPCSLGQGGGAYLPMCSVWGFGGPNSVKRSEKQSFPFWCFELPEAREGGPIWLSGCPADAPQTGPLEGGDEMPCG